MMDMLLWVLVVIFVVWMVIDCAKRKFRNDMEKIVWIVIMILAFGLGALVYFIVVKMTNPRGILTK